MANQDFNTQSSESRADASTEALYTQSYGAGSTTGYSGGDTGQDRAGEAAQRVARQAGDAAQDVGTKVGETVDRVREQAASQLDTQKDRAAGALNNVADVVRQTGDQLRTSDQTQIAQYADTAAQQIERISTYLQNHDVGELVGEVERLARRQPALFLGGAFVLGLLGARFLKSSSEQARRAQGYDTEYGGYYSGGSGYTSGYSGSIYTGGSGYGRGYTGATGSVSGRTSVGYGASGGSAAYGGTPSGTGYAGGTTATDDLTTESEAS